MEILLPSALGIDPSQKSLVAKTQSQESSQADEVPEVAPARALTSVEAETEARVGGVLCISKKVGFPPIHVFKHYKSAVAPILPLDYTTLKLSANLLH